MAEDENVKPDGAEEAPAENVESHNELKDAISAIVDKLSAIESRLDEMTKADEEPVPEEAEKSEDTPDEPPKEEAPKKEEDDSVTKTAIDLEALKEEIKKSLLKELNVQDVETPRPDDVNINKSKDNDDERDLALKVARGEKKMTFEEIEKKKLDVFNKKINAILED